MGGKRVSSDRLCAIDGCDELHLSRGWCRKHYRRWYATGDPNKVRASRASEDAESRFLSHVNKNGGYPDFSDPRVLATEQDGECWLTDYCKSGKKKLYSQVSVRGRQVYAHRFAYEMWVAPIPRGLYIDHRCRNQGCVNPKHLEPVTSSENKYRSQLIRRRKDD